ncbi:PP2C family protein-serine/threonine phosphatase [Streptomyces sp. NPDC088725]|uniref:PP2C family protein-serine/threonine phosphatase n=1 Tax=Streptomyces sp. NPDC088725 TaxID=3365873 RepID=UPI00381D86CF
MLDITPVVRVHVDALIAAQNHLGVCDAIERNAPVGKSAAMTAPNVPKVAGINPSVPAPAHTPTPFHDLAAPPGLLIQDRLAGWVSDLTALHELTERLARTCCLDDALNELLRAGAALVGARRGLVILEPADGLSTSRTLALGLTHSDLGHLETVPRRVTSYGRLLEGASGASSGGSGTGIGSEDSTGTGTQPVADIGVVEPDLVDGTSLDPRQREVAARLGYGASYAVPLTADAPNADAPATGAPAPGTLTAGISGKLGAAVWLYDEPAEPAERQRHLAGLYARYAADHLARLLELERARTRVATLSAELLPGRLPLVPGVRLTARHHTGPGGGGDWYDALPLPEGALGLSVGSVNDSGPCAVAAMGRLRASLRAYAVMEGEDPVAVLSDLELLLRLTEPARTATALFAYAEPARRRILLAGAGHAPPLLVGDRRTEFIETSLSAPLGMLTCWEAPSVEVETEPGETVLLYTDGLLRRTGDSMDRAFARLHAAAAGVPRALRHDPDAIADHVLRTVLPESRGRYGAAGTPGTAAAPEDDIVLLAVRFD